MWFIDECKCLKAAFTNPLMSLSTLLSSITLIIQFIDDLIQSDSINLELC